MSRGRLITIEGLDGVGKSTQCERVVALLRSRGITTETFREPGGTQLGEELRIALQRGHATSPIAELLLFGAARAELVATRVRPLLEEGTWVVLDRFTDSTLAYQGALGQIDEGILQRICDVASDGLKPDLTLWLDLAPSSAAQRRMALSSLQAAEVGMEAAFDDVFEGRDGAYFSRVRERYELLYKSEPLRIARIDASVPLEEVSAAIEAVITTKAGEWG